MTEELMTTQELADYLKVKLGWVYGQTRQRGEGSIPRIRVGKYIRFRLSEVMAWILEKENRAEAGPSDRFAQDNTHIKNRRDYEHSSPNINYEHNSPINRRYYEHKSPSNRRYYEQ